MPDIFSLSADTQYEGEWKGLAPVRAVAGASLSSTLESTFELCHGIDASLTTRLSAKAQSSFSTFVALGADAEAFAAAGARIRIQFSPDLFKRFGLTADAGGFLEASIAGSLSIGLGTEAIAEKASQLLESELSRGLFDAFLKELEVRAGVWGRASASLMARGYINIYGSLANDKEAGFVVEAGGAVGCEAGAGWDCFAHARIRDPKRFYAAAVRLVTDGLAGEMREALPKKETVLELFELFFPLALHGAYEIGQTLADNVEGNEAQALTRFNRTALTQIQQYFVRKLSKVAEGLLSDAFDELARTIRRTGITGEKRQQLRDIASQLVTDLRSPALGLDDVVEILGHIASFFAVVDPLQAERVRRPIGLVWTTLALIAAPPGAGPSGADVPLITPPDFIREEIEAVLGTVPSPPRFSTGISYLISAGILPALEHVVPEVSTVLKTLEDAFETKREELLTSILAGAMEGRWTDSALYKRLRNAARQALLDHISRDLFPAFERSARRSKDARLYLREVVEPCLILTVHGLFDLLDNVASGGAITRTALRNAASAIVYRLMTRNVVVLGDIIVHHVVQTLGDAFADLEQRVRNDDNHVLVTAGETIIPMLVPLVARPFVTRDAVQAFVGDIAATGGAAFGKNVWTKTRREQLRQSLLRMFLGSEADLNIEDSQAVGAYIERLGDCAVLLAPDEIDEVASLLGEITFASLDAGVRGLTTALKNLYLNVTAGPVGEMITRARAFLEPVIRAIQEGRPLSPGEIAALLDALGDAAEDAVGNVAAIVNRVIGGRVVIRILSPSPLGKTLRKSFVYTRRVPLHIRLRGANPSFIANGDLRRVFLALNSRSVTFEPEEWTYRRGTLSLRGEVPNAALLDGINVLECTVDDGVDQTQRHAAVFACNLGVNEPRVPLRVLVRQSVFDPEGADFLQLDAESVALANEGSDPFDLTRWKLMDGARHVFEFPAMTLASGEVVRIVTGDAQGGALSWGRRRPIWNNNGDAVHLVDPRGFVRAEQVYLPEDLR